MVENTVVAEYNDTAGLTALFDKAASADPQPSVMGASFSSTRRLRWRPSAESFDATGRDSPAPTVTMR
jgi:hypothetical protein